MIRFYAAFAAIAVWLTCGLPVRAEGISGTDLAASLAEQQAEARIHAALARRQDIDFSRLGLQSYAEFLNRQGIPARLDYRGLDDFGIHRDTPITFQQSGITLRSSLDLILDQLELTWTIRHEVLLITTPDGAEAQLKLRLYDVTRILPPEPPAAAAYWMPRSADYLIEVIQQTIDTPNWLEYGGPAAIEAIELNRSIVLVVSQTLQVHEKIERLLANLHHIDGHSDAGTRAPRVRGSGGLPRTRLR